MTTRYCGFELIRKEVIAELNSTAFLYRHARTGAELLSLCNDNDNKVFGVTFRTPPPDSTGVAHIIEHSVLCGSRKYPVKEPFVELLKGSLQTFLNAFTYPDKTCYPVASQNTKDFYNLIDVYLDAVFYPRLTPFVFQQEGWHVELDSPEQSPTIKGVVYNEMKGAYSSPDRLLIEFSQQAVFPDTIYRYDSGGDPRHIPDLTYEAFLAFYRAHYHPSNAFFFFYGNDDPERRLQIVDKAIAGYEHVDLGLSIPLQMPSSEPYKNIRYFPMDGKDLSQGYLTVSWLLPEAEAPELRLALRILEYILIGMPASPLRKALIESGLGEDLAGVGLEDELQQIYFSTGLKGVPIPDMERVETLIGDTLTDLVRRGIDPETVEAAINTIEFQLRENNTGNYPQGLVIMLRALTAWLYGRDPFAVLAFEPTLEKIKQRVKNGKRYFEGLIEHYLIDNRHRATVILEPDATLRERLEIEEKTRIQSILSKMGSGGLKVLVENTKRLREFQERPDPPEALAKIPTLKLTDIDRCNRIIPTQLEEFENSLLLYHGISTNGIIYLDIGFDLRVLPQDLLPYVTLFGKALLEMGTEDQDYVRLSQRINSKTGGIRPQTVVAVNKAGDSTAMLFLRAKIRAHQAEELFSILRNILLKPRLDGKERFRQIVMEQKARFERDLIPNGHHLLRLRLNAHFNEAGWVDEKIHGVSFLFFLRDLARKIDTQWNEVVESLERIRSSIVNRANTVVNITGDSEQLESLRERLCEFLSDLPRAEKKLHRWKALNLPAPEALLVPSQVNYIGKAFDLSTTDYRFHGSALVISHFLRTSWLWERIRVQGGAYGAFSAFDRFAKVLAFTSYRDPNMLRTLQIFDQTGDLLEGLELSEDELRKSIIGVIAGLDRYQLPDARGFTAMLRFLRGDDERERQQMREEVLGSTVDDFKKFGKVLKRISKEGIVVVMGSKKAIEEAFGGEGEKWSFTKVI